MNTSNYEICAEDNLKCRKLVSEILNFGLSQKQIYFMMYLLSLNLENISHSQDLSSILKGMNEEFLLMSQDEEIERKGQ